MPLSQLEPFSGEIEGAKLHEFDVRGEPGDFEVKCWRIVAQLRRFPWTPELGRILHLVSKMQESQTIYMIETMWTKEIPNQRIRIGGQHQQTCRVSDLGYDKRFLSWRADKTRLKGRTFVNGVVKVVTLINESETRALNRVYSRWHVLDEHPRLGDPLPRYTAFLA